MILRAVGGSVMFTTLKREASQNSSYLAGGMILASCPLLGMAALADGMFWEIFPLILVFGSALGAIPFLVPMRGGLGFGRPYSIVRKTPPAFMAMPAPAPAFPVQYATPQPGYSPAMYSPPATYPPPAMSPAFPSPTSSPYGINAGTAYAAGSPSAGGAGPTFSPQPPPPPPPSHSQAQQPFYEKH